MPNKKSLLTLIIVLILLVAGFFAYSQFHDKTTAKNAKVDKTPVKSQDNTKPVDATSPGNDSPVKNSPGTPTAKKTPFSNSDPTKGELFVEGKVKSVDVDKRIITIIQSMDDNSNPINPNVPVKKDAVIQDKNSDIVISQIKVGDTVSMVITADGQARAVLVNY